MRGGQSALPQLRFGFFSIESHAIDENSDVLIGKRDHAPGISPRPRRPSDSWISRERYLPRPIGRQGRLAAGLWPAPAQARAPRGLAASEIQPLYLIRAAQIGTVFGLNDDFFALLDEGRDHDPDAIFHGCRFVGTGGGLSLDHGFGFGNFQCYLIR